jgi:galactose mutarotase-like enzyme
MAECASIRNAHLSAEIAALGAELTLLRDAAGRDFLWDGDPAWWRGRAPLLFPIVGRVPNDEIVVEGERYTMRQHGIARLSTFALVETHGDRCLYRLASSDATRAAYPFDFVLDVGYALEANTLAVTATVTNSGLRDMPVSFGFHPAFRWPLPGGGARSEHALRFDAPESAPIRRLHQGLLLPDDFATPVRGDTLHLADELFVDDALIFQHPVSRGVTYASASGPSIRIEFPDMPNLGVWSKPGAGFVCIEPWYGYAAPEGFDGELRDKEGSLSVAPGDRASFAFTITIRE